MLESELTTNDSPSEAAVPMIAPAAASLIAQLRCYEREVLRYQSLVTESVAALEIARRSIDERVNGYVSELTVHEPRNGIPSTRDIHAASQIALLYFANTHFAVNGVRLGLDSSYLSVLAEWGTRQMMSLEDVWKVLEQHIAPRQRELAVRATLGRLTALHLSRMEPVRSGATIPWYLRASSRQSGEAYYDLDDLRSIERTINGLQDAFKLVFNDAPLEDDAADIAKAFNPFASRRSIDLPWGRAITYKHNAVLHLKARFAEAASLLLAEAVDLGAIGR